MRRGKERILRSEDGYNGDRADWHAERGTPAAESVVQAARESLRVLADLVRPESISCSGVLRLQPDRHLVSTAREPVRHIE
jgi:hypothetical protein